MKKPLKNQGFSYGVQNRNPILCLGNENQTIVLLYIHLRWGKYN